MRRSKRFLAAVALASSLTVGVVLTAAPSAGAATAAAAALSSTGTIFPGLDLTGVHPTSFTWTSATIATTGVVNGGVAIQTTSSCVASGSTIFPETIATGVGTGNWSCSSGALAGRTGGLIYLRAGEVVLYQFTGGVIGPMACVWLFDQAPPQSFTSYHQSCVGALASTT